MEDHSCSPYANQEAGSKRDRKVLRACSPSSRNLLSHRRPNSVKFLAAPNTATLEGQSLEHLSLWATLHSSCCGVADMGHKHWKGEMSGG